MEPPPCSPVEPVTEVIHGVSVTDPYRWLEDQDSAQTRAWLEAQREYARVYLDSISGREQIRDRMRELLDVETYDSIQKVGQRYFFRKRLPGQEQPCIYLREGPEREDRLLIDPAERATGSHTAVKPLRVSPDRRLLLYQAKEGGERTGTFELLHIESRKTLPDVLPRGYLRGFTFAPDSRSFYYVHEEIVATKLHSRAVYHHILGSPFDNDQEIFFAGEGENLRLSIVPGKDRLGFVVVHFLDKPYTDFYLWRFGSEAPAHLIEKAAYRFGPLLMKDGRTLAVTDYDAPNCRIVRVLDREDSEAEFVDVIPTADVPIQHVALTDSQILVSYVRRVETEIAVFDFFGKRLGELPIAKSDTVRFIGGFDEEDELFFERESFTKPIQIYRYSSRSGESKLWAERRVPFNCQAFAHIQVWFTAKRGSRIPMFLIGRRDVLKDGQQHAAIMTSYGGYGVPMTPQFSVFVAFMLERGCLFALPNIRGGSEFGVEWHEAAKRRNRQVAVDDFIAAAEWLIETGRTEAKRLAIFGGSTPVCWLEQP